MVRELLSVAKLVTMALRRFPDTFSNAACAAPLQLLRQLWPLFAAESLRCGLLGFDITHITHITQDGCFLLAMTLRV